MSAIYLTGYKKKNLGDDLFFISVLKRYPNTHFLFEDIPSGYYSKLFKDFNNIDVFPYVSETILNKIFIRLLMLINRYCNGQYRTKYQKRNKIEAGAYLKIGGSIFMEPSKNLKTIKKRFVSDKKYFGEIPFFYIGCNFGPYTSPVFFKSAEYVIQHCNAICFRDSYSYNLFRQYKNVSLAPDVLFGAERLFKSIKKRKKSLGISLVDFSSRKSLVCYSQAYLESISSFIQSQNAEYDLIRLFSFCEPDGDGKAISELLTFLPESIKGKTEIITYDDNINDFLMKFSELEFLIATRFHAMILGFVYGVKTVPILYSDKMLQVLDDIKSSVPAVSLDKLSKETISEAISKVEVISVNDQKIECSKQFYNLDNFINT